MIGSGLTLYPGTQVDDLTLMHLGTTLHQDIFAIFEATGETLGFIEIMDTE